MRRRICAVRSIRDYRDLDKVSSLGQFILTDGAPAAVNLSALKIECSARSRILSIVRAQEKLGSGQKSHEFPVLSLLIREFDA
jgi:hypothetical protein